MILMRKITLDNFVDFPFLLSSAKKRCLGELLH